MTVDINDFKREAKIREIKEKVKAGYDKAKQLVTEHPAESLALATTLVGSVIGLARRADRKADLKKAEQLKERYIYDRSIGGYWKTRRKLSANDMLEIERQKKLGRGLGEILRDMRLL